ncbi:hypothetical protein SEPCBS57363_005968 [Sporothrix epigloea]|uniref:B30.2/SPRY domain-containing protein n=1 Tax=Sporothrix epigloea TaxID=1892477 RepID=A0ABP0E3M7_9PEZI
MQSNNSGGYGRSSATFQHLLNSNDGDGSDGNSIHNGVGNRSTSSLRLPYGSYSLNSSSPYLAGAETESLWTGGNSTSDNSLLRPLGSRNAQLPSFSRAFEPFLRGPTSDSNWPVVPSSNTSFFAPSYLRDSVYVQRLEDQYKAKMQANRETIRQQEQLAWQVPTNAHGTTLMTASDPSATAARRASTRSMRRGSLDEEAVDSLGTYASLTNISIANAPTIPGDSKLLLSNPDMVRDLDDRETDQNSATGHEKGTSNSTGSGAGEDDDDETMTPLPSRWATDDKAAPLDVLSDGLSVKLSSLQPANDHSQQSSSSAAQEGSSVRADHFMPPQCGIYYFETTILSDKREEYTIAIGFCETTAKLTRPPGWERGSWAYHSDDGNAFTESTTGKRYGPPFGAGDVVGCGVNFRTDTAFFTKNGKDLGA